MKLEQANPFDLLANPWNSNKVSRENLNKLKKSVEGLEMFKPIIVREVDGHLQILAGFHRNEVAKELAMESVPILNLGEISEQKAKEISIIDNTRYGEDDKELLESLIESMDVELLTSSMPELETLELPELDSTFDEELAATPREEREESGIVLKFRYDDGDQADEIEDALRIVARDNEFYFADGYANLSEALYHALIRKK